MSNNKLIKEHISFSELKQWKDCSWRHKLLYIDKLRTFEQSPHLHYGTILHDACELYLKAKILDLGSVREKIIQAWDENGFDSEDFISLQTLRAESQGWTYRHQKVEDWIDWAHCSLLGVPRFLDDNFKGWKLVGAEDELYESISENLDTKFKGFIDCIIKVPQKNGKNKYWILDWKTSNARGWTLKKKSDFNIQMQLILYKHFWGTKNKIEMKDIMCGFVLLKKMKKVEKCVQLIKVSSGPKSLEKSKKSISSMLKSLDKKLYLKNKLSCKFCDFKDTEHCR
tara:strand:- start:350 stop:1198 length:849 start_codon:yes stop_codon:yes gene_type:complete